MREFAHDIAVAGMTAMSWDPWHGPNADSAPLQTLARLDDEVGLDGMRRLLDHMLGDWVSRVSA